MSLNGGAPAVPLAQAAPRKRPASGRVVPAIPLALSKPRPVKNRASNVARPSRSSNDKLDSANASIPPTPKEDLPTGAQEGTPEPVEITPAADEHTSATQADEHVDQEAAVPKEIANPAELPDLAKPPQASSVYLETPSPTTSPAATVSPPPSRKPLDRLDTSSIRIELPPAFVPSAEQQIPLSAASSNLSHRFLPFHPHSHPSHPSAGSIVFGGPESSNTSPAPPQSAGHPFAPPQFPHFNSAQQPYFVPHGHAHHFSEPHPQAIYSPAYPSPMNYNSRSQFQYQRQHPQYKPNGSIYGHGLPSFRYPPRETFMPAAENPQPNGFTHLSRPSSTTSSARPDSARQPHSATPQSAGVRDQQGDAEAVFNEPKVAFQGHLPPRQQQHAPSHVLPPYHSYPIIDTEVSAEMANAQTLCDHVSAHFLSSDFSDCSIALQTSSGSKSFTLHGHALALSRSPKFAARLQHAAINPSSHLKQLSVTLEGPFEDEDAFINALRYLYGGALLQSIAFLQGLPLPRTHVRLPDEPPDDVDEHMRHLLCYVAAGSWLEVSPVADRGLDIATRLLRYESIETALAFALEGGLNASWQSDEINQDRVSTSSSDDSLGIPEPLTTPTYDPYSTHFLHRIVDFIVNTFPRDFFLDTSALQLSRAPRLPSPKPTHESRPSRSDPRISRIRFGELPVEEYQGPPYVTTMVSSILLSLPFLVLKYILEHYVLGHRLGAETVASIMRAVVAERELRRTKAKKAHSDSLADSMTDAAPITNLFWEECVEISSQNRVGSRLVRHRRGIDTPPSSGAASEHTKGASE